MYLVFVWICGCFLIASYAGWPFFVYELFRYRLGFGHSGAASLAFVSLVMAYLVLEISGESARMRGIDLGWWSWVIFGLWLDVPLVLGIILRLRRPTPALGNDAEATKRCSEPEEKVE
jgi:hypothetical protein